MKTEHIARHSYIDVPSASQALAVSEDLIVKTTDLISSQPGVMLQTRYSLLAGRWEAVGFFGYGLGFPIRKTIHAFVQATANNLRVFELRGTNPGIPVTHLTVRHQPGQDCEVTEQPLRSREAIGYSLTNSRYGLHAAYLALAAGEVAKAKALASLFWDPPKPSYVAPNSVICTDTDVHLAHAFRWLVEGGHSSLNAELDEVGALRRKGEQAGLQAKLIAALAASDRVGFNNGLSQLLDWHETQTAKRQWQKAPEMFLCMPGIGLSVLALTIGLMTINDLPVGNTYLPTELIQQGTSRVVGEGDSSSMTSSPAT